MLTLSNTKKNLYQRCPMAYYIHYILKLREKKVGSALPFGSAIDDAQGILLTTKDIDKAKDEFIKRWTNPVINSKVIKKDYEKHIRFSKSDSDTGLFDKDEEITPWESLKRKGLMMLDGYNEQIMPEIKEVLQVQKYVKVENRSGDRIIGYIDLVAKMSDGKTYIIDNKTSSVTYDENILNTMDCGQLASYSYSGAKMGIEHDGVGYIVLDKKIRKTTKTGPRVRTQIILGKPPKEIVNKTLADYNDVLYNIKMGMFQSNSPNCDTYFGKCPCTKFIESDGTNYNDFTYVGREK